MPSVTTICHVIDKGNALLQWGVNQAIEHLQVHLVGDLSTEDVTRLLQEAKFAHKVKKQEAANVGTLAHNWIEGHLRGFNEPFPENPQAQRACEAALKWLDAHHVQVRYVEAPVYSREFHYAGKYDWDGQVDGTQALLDWKTSKGLWEEYFAQTSAYVHAVEEESGIFIPERWLLRIDKETGEFEDVRIPREQQERDFAAFAGAIQIYRWKAELSKNRANMKRARTEAKCTNPTIVQSPSS